MVNKDKTKDNSILAARAQRTLKDIGVNPLIPQDPRQWKSYIINLRTALLGLTTEEFWDIVGLSRSSGVKYESSDKSYSRHPNRKLMLLIAEAFKLEWEVPDRVPNIPVDSKSSSKMLEMLEKNNVSMQELEILLNCLSNLRKLHSKMGTKN
ncbi:hypothetical protein [Snodgrassella sp. ESL0324]|uniref:hypothetical protein n=1 Tax=Snodgrassella sp. ESL0324 TaxID=2705033 RepID=UPI001583A069|nr:hypothetical protein [Snodgrassella sp. ESL0324]NUF08951.1 hypothetical protein [Snodgrassella sp. ESL0324]